MTELEDPHALGPEGVEDMINLRNLHEQSLLANLKKRFAKNIIYTFTGSILVSVNPFKILPIYTQEIVQKYVGVRLGLLPPHIFSTAEATYFRMKEDKRNQSVIISGESGAGKTEATKLILQYLAAMTNKHSQVEQMILESSPILESFGNARTVRNNNSSRFGKFMQINFNVQGAIIGAKITQYLLEKSRIVSQAQGERNYHIFYQLTAGADDEEKKIYLLEPQDKYNYMNQSGLYKLAAIDDEEEYGRTKMALDFLGLGDKTRNIMKILGGVLQLGNVTFEPAGEGANVKNPEISAKVAQLFDVDATKLREALLKRTMEVRGQSIVIPLKPEQAVETRDALTKSMYNTLFSYLVTMINKAIDTGSSHSFIGILDIFGFENFKVNSFEQLCINYANEKLQQHFNQHIFKLEQAEYDKEKINWSKIQFNDNQNTIDLIEKTRPAGLLALLDEECRFPKASDKTFLEKITANHSSNADFEKSKRSQTTFIVRHYAGEVSYEIANFLDKNRDTLQIDLLNALLTSTSDLIQTLYKDAVSDKEDQGGAKKKLTVGGNFKNQLGELTTILSSTYGHYVRCIKPNTKLCGDLFEDDLVLAQLRYAGMLETIKIRRNGYPIRYPHEEFWKRYRMLAPEARLSGDFRGACEQMLPAVGKWEEEWQNGVTKVFLREPMYAKLEDKRNYVLSFSAIKCQSWLRMANVRNYYLEFRDSNVVIQKQIRAYLARKTLNKARESALTFQSVARMIAIRKKYKTTLEKKREEERKKREEEERRRKKEEEELKRKAEELKRQAGETRTVDQIMKDLKEENEEKKAEIEEKRKRDVEAKLVAEAEAEKEKEEAAEAEAAAAAAAAAASQPAKKKKKKKKKVIQPAKPKDPSYTKRLPRKLRAEPDDPPEIINEKDATNLSFVDFAQENFEAFKDPKSTKKKGIFGLGGKKPGKDVFNHSKKPIEAPLLSHTDEQIEKIALDIFQKILNYQYRKGGEWDAMYSIVQTGFQFPELRDEIYSQLIKQTSGCKENELLIRGWELIAYCSIAFAPSQSFLPYLAAYLTTNRFSTKTQLPGEVGALSSFALKRLRRGLNMGGKYHDHYDRMFPSKAELKAVAFRRGIECEVKLCDDSKQYIDVDNATTALEALGVLVNKLLLIDSTEYSIFLVSADGTERPLDDNELMANEFKRSEDRGDENPPNFIFKKKLFLHPNFLVPLPDDKTDTNLLLRQCMSMIQDGKLPVPDEEQAVKLAALKYRIDVGIIPDKEKKKKDKDKKEKDKKEKDSKEPKVNLKNYLPVSLVTSKAGKAKAAQYKLDIVNGAKQLANLTTEQCRMQYIQMCRQLPLFGYTLFHCEHSSQWRVPSPFFLGIGLAGVQCLKPNDFETVLSFAYGEVEVDESSDKGLTVKFNLEGGSNSVTVQLKTKHGATIVNLIKEYSQHIKNESQFAKAVKDYDVDDPNLLNFKKDEMIFILEKDEGSGWYVGEIMDNPSRKGSFPVEMVQVLLEVPKNAGPRFKRTNSSLRRRFSIMGVDANEMKNVHEEVRAKLKKTNTIIKPKSMMKDGGQQRGFGNRLSRNLKPVSYDVVDPALYPFTQYAEAHFRKAPMLEEKESKGKSLMGTIKGKKLEDLSLNARVAFSSTPIKDSLLDFDNSKINRQAADCFLDIMRYMDDYPNTLNVSLHQIAQKLIQKGIDREVLRDEIYCQLIKQTSKDNPKPDSLYRGWELLLCSVSCFLPSEKLHNYLMAHFVSNSKESTGATVSMRATECIERLERTSLKGPRIFAPSVQELTALCDSNQLAIAVYWADGQAKEVDIDSASTVADIVTRFLRSVEINTNTDGWTFFEQTLIKEILDHEVPLSREQKIGDILARWEKGSQSSTYRLVFKKWMFHDSEKPDTDTRVLSLLFHQAVHTVLLGKHPLSEDEAAQLSAYLLQIESGDYKESDWKNRVAESWKSSSASIMSATPGTEKKRERRGTTKDKKEVTPTVAGPVIISTPLDSVLPKSFRTSVDQINSIMPKIQKNWQEMAGVNWTAEQIRTIYMKKLKEWPFYGIALFPAQCTIDKKKPKPIDAFIGVNQEGVHAFEIGGKVPIKTWKYQQIASYSPTPTSFTLVTGNLVNPVRDVFTTRDASEISSIINLYKQKAASVAGRPKGRRPF
eukprot:TRINITY_DN1640_c0_g3_i4.p1 TRINITY_DN1640_c0_g3~~TRINITY_DN1640_c0_g3_i4.p1  ORF type:complete len:2134 (-),score=641.62 TRINITY_DN1640_c0_g3_i4:179-6580(-)